MIAAVDRMIEVVAGSVPRDVGQAWAHLLELRREESQRSIDRGPGAELAELYRRLIARHPSFEDDPSTPWGEHPMVLYFGERLAMVPLVDGRVADALPFVIATALKLGFTVFDVAGERIHRPDGVDVLPSSLTAGAPQYDPLARHDTSPARPAAGSNDPKQHRATKMMAGGCFLLLVALVALWTAGMLYAGFAQSLAWGEDGRQTIWQRHDVPLLMKIAIGSLVPAIGLLFFGARRMIRLRSTRP